MRHPGLLPTLRDMPDPVLTIAEMRAWEAASWSAGIPPDVVIDTVGRRVGEWLLDHSGEHDPMLFLAGRGHNGDDVRAASKWIGWRRRQRGLNVEDPGRDSPAVLGALDELVEGTRVLWVVDGLFGIGLGRAFSPEWIHLIEALNRRAALPGCRVVAMDVPSGLLNDAGGTAGAVIQAAYTLTVGAPKRGLVGLSAAGRVEVIRDIGLLPGFEATRRIDAEDGGTPRLQWSRAEDFCALPPRRPVTAHKGMMGHLMIVGGSVGYHGAAVMAARGALRAGPGLVTVVTDPAAYLPVAAQLAQAMVHPWKSEFPVPDSVNAVVVGPGLASGELPPGLTLWVASLWKNFPGPVLADASALNWMGAISSQGPRIVTPHPGEAARILGCSVPLIQDDRVASAARLGKETGSIAVLKGYHSLIAEGGSIWVNPTGNSGLAQGGAGDVLAGFIGGWLARRVAAPLAVRYGVWEHGAAADRLALRHLVDATWTVDELIAEMGRGG